MSRVKRGLREQLISLVLCAGAIAFGIELRAQGFCNGEGVCFFGIEEDQSVGNEHDVHKYPDDPHVIGWSCINEKAKMFRSNGTFDAYEGNYYLELRSDLNANPNILWDESGTDSENDFDRIVTILDVLPNTSYTMATFLKSGGRQSSAYAGGGELLCHVQSMQTTQAFAWVVASTPNWLRQQVQFTTDASTTQVAILLSSISDVVDSSIQIDAMSFFASLDTDGDLVQDVFDLDDDNDGILDTDEGFVAPSLGFENPTYGASVFVDAYPSFSNTNPYSHVNGDPRIWKTGSGFTAFEGDHYLELSAATGASTVTAWNETSDLGGSFYDRVVLLLDVTPVTTYDLTFQIRDGGREDGAYGAGGVGVVQIQSMQNGAINQSNFNPGFTWDMESMSFTVDAVTTQVAILFSAITFGSDASVQIDDVEVLDGGTPIFAESVAEDTDADTVGNFLDLDSDNDGIYDVLEIGLGNLDANNDGILDGIPADFGSNGYLNTLETSDAFDAVAKTFSYADTDTDLTLDPYDLDSDGDGCNDILEAGFADGDGDGKIASTSGASGEATGGTYALPTRTVFSNGYDFQADVSHYFGHPLSQSVLEGATLSLNTTFSGLTPTSFLWEESTDGGNSWNTVNNGGDVSGATSQNLEIANYPSSGRGNQYRVSAIFADHVCDPRFSNAAIIAVAAPDSDGDSIGNDVDLDDDNDGILDVEECPYAQNNFIKYANRSEQVVSTNGSGLTFEVSGAVITSGFVNASYSHPENVGAVSLAFTEAVAEINMLLGSISDPAEFGNFTLTLEDGTIIPNADFELTFAAVHDDFGGLNGEAVNNTNFTKRLVKKTGAPFAAGIYSVGNPGPAGDQSWGILRFKSNAANPIVGLAYEVDGSLSNCEVGISALPVGLCDADNDGVLNHLDLDSDNDGIYDILESADMSLDGDNDGQIDGLPADFGANGYLDAIENSDDLGSTTATLTFTDTDNDNILDAYEIDSDNDLCYDVSEAGFLGDAEGKIGTNVNSDGLVDGASYALPTMTNLSNGFDFQFDGAYITDHPVDEAGVPGEILGFGATLSAVPTSYQWQESLDYGFSWTNLVDDGTYLGTSNGAMAIDPVQEFMSGRAYRLGLTFSDYACGTIYTNSAALAVSAESDGDLVEDAADLDDDNDGILDLIENGIEPPAAGCVLGTADFTNPSLISGTNGELNAVYQFDNVLANINVRVRITDKTPNVNLVSMDQNIQAGLWEPRIGLAAGPTGTLEFMEFEVSFFDAALLPIEMPCLCGTFHDVDTNFGEEVVELIDPTAFSVDATTDLLTTISNNGNVLAFSGGLSGSVFDIQNQIFSSWGSGNSFRIRLGTYNNSDQSLHFEFGNCAATRLPNPSTFFANALDTDSDGIPNRLDLDSDNDGISDLIESGRGGVDANNDGRLDGAPAAYGANGFVDGFETTPDNGIPDFTPTKTTAANNFDFLELDSDSDGILDRIEGQDNGNAFDILGTDEDQDGFDDQFDVDFAGNNAFTPKNTDQDPTPDYRDLDSDNDAIADTFEQNIDFDADGIANYRDLDSDNDGIADITEAGYAAFDNNDNGVIEDVDLDEDGVQDNADDLVGFGGYQTDFRDTDSDGDLDHLDLDSDDDTISDKIEAGFAGLDANAGPMLSLADSDNDGISDSIDSTNAAFGNFTAQPQNSDTDPVLNYRDLDSDNDGVADELEMSFDFDQDGLGNYIDLDSDNDGISDIFESGHSNWDGNNNGYIDNGDSDGDGIVNNADSDDGVFGGWNGFVRDTDNDSRKDYLDLDSDNDGIPDAHENGYKALDTDLDGKIDYATVAYDTDRDGILDVVDAQPAQYGWFIDEPLNSDDDSFENYIDLDADDDGISDVVEANDGLTLLDPDGDGKIGTGPISDGDNDGLSNLKDIHNGGSIADADFDSDGLDNFIDIDSDGDGIPDTIEAQPTLNYVVPSDFDADNDGLNNNHDADGSTAIVPVNTENQEGPDFLDLDSDNDGRNDIIEGWDTNNDGIADTTTSGDDSDGDGLDDNFDSDGTDSDNDGLADDDGKLPTSFPDVAPAGGEMDWRFFSDRDGDGISDHQDFDDDNDGIVDSQEGFMDMDGDGWPNHLDLDSDGDGISDVLEANGGDPSADLDQDGLVGVAPFQDADNDGVSDFVDTHSGGTPLPDPNTDNLGGKDRLDIDSDNDGIIDFVEAQTMNGFLPLANNDNDDDGIDDNFDADEVILVPLADSDSDLQFDYRDQDSDNDGLADSIEGWDTNGDGVAETIFAALDSDLDGLDNAYDADATSGINAGKADNGTTAYNDFPDVQTPGGDRDWRESSDTDGDGILDAQDLDIDNDGLPNDWDGYGDFDGDGLANYLDLDSDGDGISDVVEANGGDASIDPDQDGKIGPALFADSDNDGLSDLVDIDDLGSSIPNPNTDGNGNPDFLDLDSDDDGIPDFIEAQNTADFQTLLGEDVDQDGIDDRFDIDFNTLFELSNIDGGGFKDYRDNDSDDDGKIDRVEGHDSDGDGTAETVPANADADNDGIDDAFDADGNSPANNAGPSNGGATPTDFPDVELPGGDRDWREMLDKDNDGIADLVDLDADNDGILNTTEGFEDFDGDGLANYLDLDSDGDGIADVIEANAGLANSDPNGDAQIGDLPFVDTDQDGLSDVVDTDNGGTPLQVPNSDDDSNPDFLDYDSDNDGIVDFIEAQTTADFDDVSSQDSDSDGLNNTFDGDINSALIPTNTDGTDTPDYIDSDSDNDSKLDILEGWDTDGDGIAETIATGQDADGDGLDNAFDVDGLSTDDDGTADNIDTTPQDFPDVELPGGDRDWRQTLDSDNDGIIDTTDLDSDNDGILDATEGTEDFDGDGLPNYLDLDSDGDGISDVVETNGGDATIDPDLDGKIGPALFADTDNDGLSDIVDTDNGGIALEIPNTDGTGNADYLDIDSDDDGIIDLIEAQTTDGFLPLLHTDSDFDGLDNQFDSNSGSALVPVSTFGSDLPDYRNTDTDGDNKLDILEGWDTNADGTAETLSAGNDSDNDGLDNAFDVDGNDTTNNGTADNGDTTPTDFPDAEIPGGDHDWRQFIDTDSDGIADTNDLDADNDGILNTTEGTEDFDGDGIANYLDLDSDNDGIFDVVEANNGDASIDPDQDGKIGPALFADADNDGLSDIVDTDNGGTALEIPNTDGTGNADYLDIDSDGDGIIDLIEAQNTIGAFILANSDSDFDGIDNNFDIDEVAVSAPTDTDQDGTPDYIDFDSDGDSKIDILEGWDTNADGTAETLPSGNDSDNDGLDDAFDTDGNGAINNGTADNGDTVPTDFPDAELAGGDRDWRETIDFDADGTPNALDPDDNNDGILDADVSGDTDGDGIADIYDYDIDGDGILNIIEAFEGSATIDPDFDGVPGVGVPLDTDNDGLIDIFDTDNGGTILPTTNSDTDALQDWQDLDSDGDGIIDAIEAQTTENYISPVAADSDMDGINDNHDVDGGNPILPVDTDQDGTPDYLDQNADNDLVADAIEGWDGNGDGLAETVATGSDMDNDGLDDAFDADVQDTDNLALADNGGTVPTDFPDTIEPGGDRDWRDSFLLDTDGDGEPDETDTDIDGDGIVNAEEENQDTDGDGITNDLDIDSDNDGIADAIETNIDTDNDGLPNYIDLDADNDGISDIEESGQGDEDSNADGMADGFDTDQDGLLDSVDSLDGFGGFATNQTNTDGAGAPNYIDLDSDGDSYTDLFESGFAEFDADIDGMLDGVDNDNDGISDEADSAVGDFGGFGFAPRDTDLDDVPNYIDLDSDGDGLEDGSADTLADCDEDGLVDYLDPDICPETLEEPLTLNELVTPNGDGVNDTWNLGDAAAAQQNKVQIFNRWGSMVFESDNYQNDWYGQSNTGGFVAGGGDLPAGTYYYFIYTNGTAKAASGNLFLKRE